MYKIIGADQQEYGPVGPDQIRAWIAERRLAGHSLVQAEGQTDWVPLSALPEFTEALTAAGPMPPAPLSPEPAMSAPAVTGQSTNGLAVAGFVTGLLSLFCCGPLFGLVGLGLSGAALYQLRDNPRQKGKPLAIAGLILSALGLIFFVVMLMRGSFRELMDKLR